MKLIKAFRINRDIWFHPERIKRQLKDKGPKEAWRFFAFDAGWLLLIVIIWLSIQAVNAFYNIPVYYPEYFWKSIPENWTLNPWYNLWIGIKYSGLVFASYILVIGPILFFFEIHSLVQDDGYRYNRYSKEDYNLTSFGSLYWVFTFTGALTAILNSEHQYITLFTALLFTVLVKTKFIRFGEYTIQADKVDTDESLVVFVILFPLLIWIAYGIIANISDEIDLSLGGWFGRGLVCVPVFGYLFGGVAANTLGFLVKRKQTKEEAPLLFGIILFFIIQGFYFFTYACLFAWNIVSVYQILYAIAASFSLWVWLYYNIGNWLLFNGLLLTLGKLEHIMHINSPLPVVISEKHLEKIIIANPIKALAIGNFLFENHGHHKKIAKQIIASAASKIDSKNNADLRDKIDLLLSKIAQ